MGLGFRSLRIQGLGFQALLALGKFLRMKGRGASTDSELKARNRRIRPLLLRCPSNPLKKKEPLKEPWKEPSNQPLQTSRGLAEKPASQP